VADRAVHRLNFDMEIDPVSVSFFARLMNGGVGGNFAARYVGKLKVEISGTSSVRWIDADVASESHAHRFFKPYTRRSRHQPAESTSHFSGCGLQW